MIPYKLAKKYLDLGMSVFPVNLKRADDGKILKLPAVPWKPYQNRLPTKEELHFWFDGKKYNGIGLATGKVSGVVVIDVEHDATESTKKRFDKAMWVSTISGGSHHYYRWTKELRNTVKIFNDQVDFRGDGGYVVLPDSKWGSDGYSWGKGPIEKMFLPELPGDIEKALTVRPDLIPSASGILSDDGTIFKIAEQGERNMTAAQVAGSILKMMDRRFYDPYGWFILKDWNDLNEPPLSEKELRTTWSSILKAERRQGSFKFSGQKFELYSGEDAKKKYDEVRAKYEGGLTTGIEKIDDYFKLLPGQLYLISAPTHEGKTTFVLNVAAKVASFEYKVIYASLEQSYQVVPRIESIIGGNIPPTLGILTTGEMLSVETLKDICREHSPDLFVIDHIQFMKKMGKGQTEDTDELVLNIQQMAHEMEIPIMVVAHTRKINSDRPLTLDDLRSSSSLAQVPAVVCLIRKKAQKDEITSNRGELKIAKNRVNGKLGDLNFTLEKSGEIIFT